MEKTDSPWSVPVAVDEIPDTGLRMEIAAPREARAAIADLAGVRDVEQLAAEFNLTRRGAGVHVVGRVHAKVGQTCVVTLDPVENDLDETIDVRFMPGAGTGTGDHTVHVPDEDEESPEPLIGGAVDLGALATEFLILGVDPYPRKPGAEFTPPAADDAGERPFAALAALKNRLGGGTK
jgi:hypothetical protein